MITVPSLDDSYFLKLENKIDAEFQAIEINTGIIESEKELDCFNIVKNKVSEFGGNIILGWQIWKTPMLIEAEAHAVWEDENEFLHDISPKPFNFSPKKIVFIEDPFEENDFKSFAALRKKLGKKVEIVGDDLTVTNVKRVKKAIKTGACNCLLLKVNQIGTISEALTAAMTAKAAGWNVLVSHRSGETEDTFIADLTCALGNGKIKTGAPCRGERVAKYNRLLNIYK